MPPKDGPVDASAVPASTGGELPSTVASIGAATHFVPCRTVPSPQLTPEPVSEPEFEQAAAPSTMDQATTEATFAVCRNLVTRISPDLRACHHSPANG